MGVRFPLLAQESKPRPFPAVRGFCFLGRRWRRRCCRGGSATILPQFLPTALLCVFRAGGWSAGAATMNRTGARTRRLNVMPVPGLKPGKARRSCTRGRRSVRLWEARSRRRTAPGHDPPLRSPPESCGYPGCARQGARRWRSLLREPDRRADTSLEDGVGLGAVRGRACELQRPGEKSQEGRRVCPAHLLAPF
jgi:hypothetical protein